MSDVSGTLEQVLGSLAEYRLAFGRISVREDVDELGFGGYGTVRLGDLHDWDGHPTVSVAVKVLRTPSVNRRQRATTAFRLARELKIWAGLIHPNILRLIGFCLSEDLDEAWLVSPYEASGNLTEYITRENPDQPRRLEIIIDTAKGLLYLHSHNPTIVHGDLKPANVFIGQDGSAKLCDFGLAKALDDPTGLTSTTSVRGSPRYMGPELLEDNATLSTHSDVWAWACIAGEVLTGLIPYHAEQSQFRLFMRIGRGEMPISLDGFPLPARVGFCIMKCWQPVPARPSISSCLDNLLNPTAASARRTDPSKVSRVEAGYIAHTESWRDPQLSGSHPTNIPRRLPVASPMNALRSLADLHLSLRKPGDKSFRAFFERTTTASPLDSTARSRWMALASMVKEGGVRTLLGPSTSRIKVLLDVDGTWKDRYLQKTLDKDGNFQMESEVANALLVRYDSRERSLRLLNSTTSHTHLGITWDTSSRPTVGKGSTHLAALSAVSAEDRGLSTSSVFEGPIRYQIWAGLPIGPLTATWTEPDGTAHLLHVVYMQMSGLHMTFDAMTVMRRNANVHLILESL